MRRGRVPSAERLRSLCDALGLEFYIGPPRDTSASTEAASAVEQRFSDEALREEVRNVLRGETQALREELVRRETATETTLKEIISRLPRVSQDLTDEEKEKPTPDKVVEFPDARDAEAHEQDPTALCSHGFRPLPRRGARIAAGYGAFIESEPVIGHLAFREDWLLKYGINHEKADIVEVMGNSMEPTLPDGSLILVDYQRTRRRSNRIFVVRSDDLVLIKRLVKDRHGEWLLVSDNNKEYKPVPWPREAVVIGQVMWTGRTL